MPRLPGNKNLLDQPLYDTMQLTAAANQVYNFFSVPLGGLLIAGVPKTYAHTNLVQSGTLEKGSTFTIKGVLAYFVDEAQGGAGITLADAREINRRSWIDVLLGQVSFFKLPLQRLPGGGAGLYYFSNEAAAANLFYVQKGWPAFQNEYHLREPIDIDEQEAITVELHVEGTPAAIVDMSIHLTGLLSRPVR